MTRNILIISPIPTHPNNSGNRARLYALLKTLQQSGCLISFLYLEKWPGANIPAMNMEWDRFEAVAYSGKGVLKKLTTATQVILEKIFPNTRGAIDKWFSNTSLLRVTRPLGVDDWYSPNVDKAVLRLKANTPIDAVIVEYVYLSKALENFGDEVIKIIDTHDVFSNRHQQFISLGKNPVFFYTSPEQEAKGLNRADLILAIQEDDRRFLAGLCTREVITIGHVPPFVLDPARYSSQKPPSRLLYVATNIVPNQEAIDFFIDDVWPRILALHPHVEVDIVGGIGAYLKSRPETNFKLHFHVNDLNQFYIGDSIVINPTRIGTGIKIKNLEALFMGKPLVTTSIGAQGLEKWAGKAFLVANDAETFADCVHRLLSDTGACIALSEEALKFAKDYRRDYEQSISDFTAVRLNRK